MEFPKAALSRLRYWAGYVLFAAAVAWLAVQLPAIDVKIGLANIVPASVLILAMLGLEILQFRAFLVNHDRSVPKADLAELITRKALLNAIMPAQAGTLLVMRSLTTRFRIRWDSYLRFIVFTSGASALASLVAYVALLLPPAAGIGLLFATFGAAMFMSRNLDTPIGASTNAVWLTSIGLLAVRAPIFWLLFAAVAHEITWSEAVTLAIVMNAVNQFPITPGNLGIRELTLGGLSEWAGVPGAVGVLVGVSFMLLRVATYGVAYLVVLVSLRWGQTKEFPHAVAENRSESTSAVPVEQSRCQPYDDE